MEVRAIQKSIIVSPRKLREVARLTRKMTPMEAVDKLPFVGKRAAEPLKKVVMSALANARQKGLNDQDLKFKEIQINEGPRLKRFRAGARGRAKPYRRWMSHIRVVLVTKESRPKTVKSEKNPEKVSKKSNLKAKSATPVKKETKGKK